MSPRELLTFCQSETPSLLKCLKEAVEIESPSSSRTGVDRIARFFAREFEKLHGTVSIHEHPTTGPAVVAEFWAENRSRKPTLVLGHTDTIWNEGTLEQMPFRVRGRRAYGPGILDMKSGIVCGLWAIRALQAMGIAPGRPVRFFLNPDEEISSLAFRKQIMAEARRAQAALVLEPAAERGALKTARKGVGEFRITVHGRPAHAGVNPGAGVNAISELAKQLLRIEKFAHPHQWVTLNVGTISGGTRRRASRS